MSPDLKPQEESSQIRARPPDGAAAADSGSVLRVLHLLWSGTTGGLERAVYQLVREQLAGDTVRPAVLFAGPGGPYHDRLVELGCQVEALGLASARSLRQLTVARQAMRGYDVHHFHAAEPLLMAASAACPGVARVYTHRGGFTEGSFRRQARFRLAGPVVRRAFHAYSGNTAHGAWSGAKLMKIDFERFEVTYNGIEFSLLEPARPAQAVRDELGLTDEFVVGTAAILKDWKRVDRLVQVLPALRQAGPVRLLIVGDGPERPRLEDLARDLGVESDVVFAGLQQHVADYLQVMDVFCLPSSGRESFGNAVTEAMVLGVPPVVFADSPGLTEHIEHGRTGFIVETHGELVAALEQLRADPELRDAIGKNAQADIRGRYTLERSARAYEALYESAMKRSA